VTQLPLPSDRSRRRARFFLLGAVAILVSATPGDARITRLVVEHTETLAGDGYKKLTGKAYGELDPKLPLNAIITDLELAPRNARGMVEYAATFTILQPADLSKTSGVLLYFVPNRGRVDLTRGGFLTDARKQGHVLAASGWQADIGPADGVETLSAPVAKNADGSAITGRVLARFADMPADATTLPILRGGVAGTADPASLDTSQASLTRRASEHSQIVPLHSSTWAFADCSEVPFPGKPDPRKLCLKDGFDPAYLYELVYTAKDPKVHGIGFAATRDLNSYLRYGVQDDTGAVNPLRGRITAIVSQGNSQSGTFLRSFIHLGFNQDESGRIVFDGSNPNIAFRLLAMNIRFAAPSGAAAMYEPGSDGVVWWEDYVDDVRGRPTAGDRNLSEDRGNVRLGGVLQPARLSRSGGNSRRPRYPAATQCPALLFSGREARRRTGWLRRGSAAAVLLRAGAQSQSIERHVAGDSDGACRLGGKRHAASAQPISPTRPRGAGCARAGRDGFPGDSRNAASRWSPHATLPVRVRT